MSLELNNVGWYFAENYASLQLAIDAIPITGGTLVLSNKNYDLSSSATLIVDKPITIIGQGGEDVYLQHSKTLLWSSSATNNIMEVQHPGFMMSGVGFKNTNASVTTSIGLKIDIRGTHPTANELFPNGVGSNFNIRECTFNGFNKNIDIINAFAWNITDCMFFNSKEAGLRIASEQLPDAGDNSITGCQFYAGKYNGGYAVLQNSSGGTRLINNKINQFPHVNGGKFSDCFVFIADYSHTPAGVLAGTTILMIANNSFENFTGHAINVNGLSCVHVTNCQIDAYIATTGILKFTYCSRGMVGGIMARKVGSTPYFASFSNCSDWEILNNMDKTWGGSAYSLTSCTGMKKSADTVSI